MTGILDPIHSNPVSPLGCCPGCSSSDLGAGFFIPNQPVILNYRFNTADAARGVERRDIFLRECNVCGLVFNSILDAGAIPYDANYENRQNFSASFLAMLEHTADELTARHLSEYSTVLEVGCGKGDFLELICKRANCRGLGFDTSCEENGTKPEGKVAYFQRYVTTQDVTEKIDLIVCRHVVEHVPQIGEFFQLLHRLASVGGGSSVYVETPSLEWIVDRRAFWDIFYEHCNYFTPRTLLQLAELAGFEILNHQIIFGGQYQSLELRPRGANTNRPSTRDRAVPLLGCFTEGIRSSHHDLVLRLSDAGFKDGWAIWGAGAKGVSLAGALQNPPASFVVDSNPAKQGSFIPGTSIPVVPPTDARIGQIAVVLIANPNYATEVGESLAGCNFYPRIMSL